MMFWLVTSPFSSKNFSGFIRGVVERMNKNTRVNPSIKAQKIKGIIDLSNKIRKAKKTSAIINNTKIFTNAA